MVDLHAHSDWPILASIHSSGYLKSQLHPPYVPNPKWAFWLSTLSYLYIISSDYTRTFYILSIWELRETSGSQTPLYINISHHHSLSLAPIQIPVLMLAILLGSLLPETQRGSGAQALLISISSTNSTFCVHLHLCSYTF